MNHIQVVSNKIELLRDAIDEAIAHIDGEEATYLEGEDFEQMKQRRFRLREIEELVENVARTFAQHFPKEAWT